MSSSDQLANLQSRGLVSPYEADLIEIKAHIDAATSYLTDAQNKHNGSLTRFMVGNMAGHTSYRSAQDGGLPDIFRSGTSGFTLRYSRCTSSRRIRGKGHLVRCT